MDDNALDVKSFKVTIETLNPDYLGGEIDAIEEHYGSGYLAIISTADDTSITVAHGNNHKVRTVQSFVNAMENMDNLPLLLVETIAKLMFTGMSSETVMKMSRMTVTAVCLAMSKDE